MRFGCLSIPTGSPAHTGSRSSSRDHLPSTCWPLNVVSASPSERRMDGGRLGCLHGRCEHAVGDLMGGAHPDIDKANPAQSSLIFVEREGSGDAAGIAPALGSMGGREVVAGDDVADVDPPAWAQDPRHLGEYRGLVHGQV